MSNLKTYRVSAYWHDEAEVTLQVDHDVLTPELATEINQFWSGADRRLAEENGDVVRTVIRMFGAAAIRHFMDDGGACFSAGTQAGREWAEEVLRAQYEGWPCVDGLGVLITEASVQAVDYDDVTLEGA